MKRMAAVLAVIGAMTAMVPATAPAATTDKDACSLILVLRFC